MLFSKWEENSGRSYAIPRPDPGLDEALTADLSQSLEKLRRFRIDPAELGAYLDIHKYGMPPHGGLGIGLERLVMKLLNLSNIRMASLFPRDIHHLDP